MIPRVALVAGAAAAGIAVAAASGPVVVPGDDLPEAVVALGALEDATALAVSGDRDVAAAAFPPVGSEGRSILRFARGPTVRQLELAGATRALVLSHDGATGFAIVHESDRKGRPRRTSVLRIDLAAVRATATIALPITAQGLALGAGGGTLLVASRDEIRTFVLPDLTSGPLFRLIGENVAAAPLAASSRLLVAQGNDVVLVDLASAQDRDGLKILERARAETPLRSLVSAPDGPVALALASGGAAFDVAVDPLELRPRASAVAVAWPGVAAAPEAPPAPAVAAMGSVPPPPPNETTPATPGAEADVAAAPVETPPAVAEPEIPAALSETPPAPVEERVASPPPPPPPPPHEVESAHPPGTVAGTISGPARELVAAVVALGPDNVLTEAGRITPDASGRFAFLGLAPGSYRIVAAGAGGRVLACEPPFVTIRLEPGRSVDLPPLEVLKGY